MTFPRSLLDEIQAQAIDTWRGTLWRQVFTGTPPLRSNVRGGRWNPPGTEALYASLLPETATAEIDFLMSMQPVPITRGRVTWELDATLSAVADLSDETKLARVGLTVEDLKAVGVGRCRYIGAAAASIACTGLLVPSARYEGINLVVFVDNLGTNDLLQESVAFPYPPGPPATK